MDSWITWSGQLLLEGEGSIDFQRALMVKDPRTQEIADILNRPFKCHYQ